MKINNVENDDAFRGKVRLNKYYVVSFVFLIISFFLTNHLISVFLNLKKSNEYYDALGYLQIAKGFKHDQYLVPMSYYLRAVVPFFTILTTGIQNHSTYCLLNLILTFFSIYLFLFALLENVLVSIKKDLVFAFAAISTLFPSILFVNATMKPEWQAILIGALILMLQNQVSYFSKVSSLVIGIFARHSIVFTAVYLFFKPQIYSWKNIVLFYLFVPIFSLFLIDSYWLLSNHSSYFDSTIYKPNIVESHNLLRGWLSIHSLDEFWKFPLKVMYSSLLESNLYAGLHGLKNPEAFNNMAGFMRIVTLGIFMYLGGYVKNNNGLFRKVFFIYLSFLIPPIIFTGFYQTRYLIVSDFVIYSYFLILIVGIYEPNKIIINQPIDDIC